MLTVYTGSMIGAATNPVVVLSEGEYAVLFAVELPYLDENILLDFAAELDEETGEPE